MRPLLPLLALAALAGGESLYDDVLKNPLGQSWPLELVRRDLPAGVARQVRAVRIGEAEPVPVQADAEPNADGTVSCWFRATLEGETTKDARGRARRGPAPREVPLRFVDALPMSAFTVRRTGGRIVVDNGIYSLSLTDYGTLEAPVPLKDLPHFLAGLRVPGVAEMPDGRGSFVAADDLLVRSVTTEVLAAGLVFTDIRFTYVFDEQEPTETVDAPEFKAGKRSHRWEGFEPPMVKVPKRERHYEVLVRCVAGDPWIEVVERYRLPAGTCGRVDFGGKDGWALDTALWLRWFEYDRFGGNNKLLRFPLTPRPEQTSNGAVRPFAHLQPVWTQRGAFSQDVYFAGGGVDGKGADPTTVPCVGVAAAYASKWVNPYDQVIRAHVADGNRAWVEFPLEGAGQTGFPYGRRCWGLVAGRRADFDDAGEVNGIVRRRTNWTLDAVANDYVLNWGRDAKAAVGPVLLTTRRRLDELAAAWARRSETPDDPAVMALERAVAERAELVGRRDELEAQEQAAEGDARKQIGKRRKGLERQLNHQGWELLDMITGAAKPRVAKPPEAGLWMGSRYSDDFLNPTSPPTRRIKGAWVDADLHRGEEPIGGPAQAAMAYIFADPDHWPGWLFGWHPGNPNFHTDKYQVLAYTAACLNDHPEADRWLDRAWTLFREDVDRTLLDSGVGYECPGYSGYALGHQLDLARIFLNAGKGNLVAEDPRFKRTADWHRRLLTPPDPRLGGRRHEAPHGDTHRWFAGAGPRFADLACFLAEDDPAEAAGLLGAYALATAGEERGGPEAVLRLLHGAAGIEPADPATLDWSSKVYEGFGAILRCGFGTPRESFVSMKAGHMRGHYHNDELAFHYYGAGVPLALDYNCSYHPRGDHAALHNSMTFGKAGELKHNGRNEKVEAMEQLHGTATVLAFGAGDGFDWVVAERSGDGLRLSPVDPHDAEFARGYPWRQVAPITHRRTLALVSHPEGSALEDYLVVRDVCSGQEPQQLNLHLLAREAQVDGKVIRCPGQWSRDAIVYLAHAPEAKTEVRSWHYGAGNDHVEDGATLIPPEGHEGPWTPGEYQVWLRVHTPAATPLTWIIYPLEPGKPEPEVTSADEGKTLTVKLGEESETIRFEAESASIER